MPAAVEVVLEQQEAEMLVAVEVLVVVEMVVSTVAQIRE